MTVLAPMSVEAYASYKQAEVAAFAEENVACGRWAADGAVERSQEEFEALLPQGLATPDNHLFEIRATEAGPAVGFLWFAVEERHGIRGAYVYDVSVKQAFRRQGHARRAFGALEAVVASMGLSRITLQLSGSNPQAQALYGQLGFAVTGISMLKQIPKQNA
ncbi:MAG: GNAT family N-acetyltransferase [Pseudomonadota bacterium]